LREPEQEADEEQQWWSRALPPPSPAITVEGVGARLGQAEAVQLLPCPPFGPIPESVTTVSHFRIVLAIIRSVSKGSKNSGSSLPLLSQLYPTLLAKLFAE